jgi:lipid-A-disaccharide synthase
MSNNSPIIFLVACEPSGDLLGARLMVALKKILGGHVQFAGVGGERMQEQGLPSLFHQSELALFGLFELLPKIPHILSRLKQTAQAALDLKPDVVITIDGPDFSFRLAKKLKGSGIPLVHYVAPTVWAWRAGRAKKIARLYNHLLCILPFEPPYFTKEGLNATFVGHSVIEQKLDQGDAQRLRQNLSIDQDKKIITVLPGSRRSEIKRLAPLFGQTLTILKEKLPAFAVVVPTVPQVHDFLIPYLQSWPIKPFVVMNDVTKYDAFAASHLALAASGTVALELGLAGTPNIIAYRLNPFTAALYRRFIKVKFVNLINLLLGRAVVPELLQQLCSPQNMADALIKLWHDDYVRAAQKAAFTQVGAMLMADHMAPSEKAARQVCAVAGIHVK